MGEVLYNITFFIHIVILLLNVLIIENTTDVAKIDTSDIFLCGFSSKGKDRGIGLYNVANILKKYPNVSIITQSKDFHFRQTIEMR